MSENKLSFEAAMTRLEEIVRLLEKGDTALEDSLSIFEEGTSLIKYCGKLLDDAELTVVRLTKGADGEPVESVFEEEE